jgi:hypothetical protein
MNKSSLNNSQFSNTLYDKIEISHVNQLKELIMSVSSKPHITKRLLSALTFCILRTNKIAHDKSIPIIRKETVPCFLVKLFFNKRNISLILSVSCLLVIVSLTTTPGCSQTLKLLSL